MTFLPDSTHQSITDTDSLRLAVSGDTIVACTADTSRYSPLITTDSCHTDSIPLSTTPVIELQEGLYASHVAEELPFKDNGLFLLLLIELSLSFFFIIHRKKIFSWQSDGDTFYTRERNHSKHLIGYSARVRNTFLLYTFLVEGTIAAIAFYTFGMSLPIRGGFATNALLLALPFTLYFLLQQGIYSLLAGLFAPDMRGREWCDQHIILHLILGLGLFPLVPLSAYLPQSGAWAIYITIGLYFIVRILFIIKGVKLFLQDFRGLLYFILYLCTLEIAPLLLIADAIGLI